MSKPVFVTLNNNDKNRTSIVHTWNLNLKIKTRKYEKKKVLHLITEIT